MLHRTAGEPDGLITQQQLIRIQSGGGGGGGGGMGGSQGTGGKMKDKINVTLQIMKVKVHQSGGSSLHLHFVERQLRPGERPRHLCKGRQKGGK